MEIGYNNDFNDFINNISSSIIWETNNTLDLFGIGSGYYKNSNDSYYNQYRMRGEKFPVYITLVYNFPWYYSGWGGYQTDSKDYDVDKQHEHNTKHEGMLIFKKIFNFELKIDPELFKLSREDFKVEPDEFLNLPRYKFTLDKTKSKNPIKKFTPGDLKQIKDWYLSALLKILKDIDVPIKAQVSRRFDEVFKFNEKIALDNAPQNVQDIFLF